jgi:hypothetical protein
LDREKKMRLISGLAVAGVLALSSGAFGAVYFADNFATFAPGNLAGQNGYTQLGSSSLNPIQVSGGKVVIPALTVTTTTDSQDVYKDLSTAAVAVPATVYVAALVTIDSPTTQSPSYFLAATTGVGGSGFANERIVARDSSGTVQFGARVTGQSGSPFNYGGGLSTGVEYLLVAVLNGTGSAADSISLYINPTTPDLSGDTAYVVSSIGSGTPPTAFGSLVISQFASATTGQSGLSIGALSAASTASEAITAIPEPTAVLPLLAGGLVLARRRRA